MPPIQTVKNILDILNKGVEQQEWFEVPDIYAMTTVKVSGSGIVFNPSNGVLLRVFINVRTAEVRTFIAKYLDIPERDFLINDNNGKG